MLAHLFHRVARVGRHLAQALRRRLAAATRPAAPTPVVGTLADLARSRPALVAENALLRQQLLLVLLTSRLRTWRQALLLVRPETVLRWHRRGFRLFWRRKSAPQSRPAPLAQATIDLIRQMARENPLWGTERIGGSC
jgi:putative transposase